MCVQGSSVKGNSSGKREKSKTERSPVYPEEPQIECRNREGSYNILNVTYFLSCVYHMSVSAGTGATLFT